MRLDSAFSRGMAAIAVICAGLAALLPRVVEAQTPVSIELVLAVDTSLSVDDIEHGLQMRGIAQAFRSPEVVELIGLQDGVAVTLIQWAGWVSSEHRVPWRRLTTPASIRAFADEVERAGRERVGFYTAIGTAIEAGLQAMASNRFAGRQLKIDISGDGRSNAGPLPAQSRRLAAAQGVTINALAVLTDVAELDGYYRREVITGPDAFAMTARDYGDFEDAIRRKLLRELAPAISRGGAGRPAAGQALRSE